MRRFAAKAGADRRGGPPSCKSPQARIPPLSSECGSVAGSSRPEARGATRLRASRKRLSGTRRGGARDRAIDLGAKRLPDLRDRCRRQGATCVENPPQPHPPERRRPPQGAVPTYSSRLRVSGVGVLDDAFPEGAPARCGPAPPGAGGDVVADAAQGRAARTISTELRVT
jgi:hypothetical protein